MWLLVFVRWVCIVMWCLLSIWRADKASHIVNWYCLFYSWLLLCPQSLNMHEASAFIKDVFAVIRWWSAQFASSSCVRIELAILSRSCQVHASELCFYSKRQEKVLSGFAIGVDSSILGFTVTIPPSPFTISYHTQDTGMVSSVSSSISFFLQREGGKIKFSLGQSQEPVFWCVVLCFSLVLYFCIKPSY